MGCGRLTGEAVCRDEVVLLPQQTGQMKPRE